MKPSNEKPAKESLNIISVTGFIAGTLDLLAALIIYYIRTGKGPTGVFRFIASGVFGNDAFGDNTMMIFWGLIFHYIIAYSWTAGFFLAYPYFKVLQKNSILVATVYGGAIWLVMNLIVLPLSLTPVIQLTPGPSVLGALVLMTCIGLPVTLKAQKYYSKK